MFQYLLTVAARAVVLSTLCWCWRRARAVGDHQFAQEMATAIREEGLSLARAVVGMDVIDYRTTRRELGGQAEDCRVLNIDDYRQDKEGG